MVQQMASKMRVGWWALHWGRRKAMRSEGSSAAVMVERLGNLWVLGTAQQSGPLLEQR